MIFTKLPFTNKYDGKTSTIDGCRHYVTPKGNYPSITTVLSKTADDTWLKEWRERVGDEEADRISLAATTKGTGLHSLCENYITGEQINDVSQVPGASKMMFNHLKPVIDKNLTGYWVSEVALYSDRFRIAGRTDLIGLWRGVSSCIDYKSNHSTGNKNECDIDDYFLQTCAYAEMWHEMYPELPKIEQGVLLIASLYHRQVFEFDIKKGYRGLVERRKKYFEMFEQPKEKIVWF